MKEGNPIWWIVSQKFFLKEVILSSGENFSCLLFVWEVLVWVICGMLDDCWAMDGLLCALIEC